MRTGALFRLALLVVVCSLAGRASAEEAPARSLSLDQAVQIALANNSSFVVTQQDVAIAEAEIVVARGIFVPRFVADLHYTGDHSPGNAFRTESTDQQVVSNLGLVGRLPTGLDYRAEWTLLYERLDNPLLTIYKPIQATTLRLTVTQPLLRNAWLEVNRAPIVIASLKENESRFLREAEVERVVAEVEVAYWSLVLSIKERQVLESAVALVEQQLAQSRIQLKLGTVSDIDVTEVEADIARRNDEIAAANEAIAETEGRILALLQEPVPPGTSALAAFAPVLPSETMPVVGSLADLLARAKEHRPDLAAARANLQAEQVAVAVAHNRLLPQLDVYGNIGLTGFSGTLDRSEYATSGFNTTIPGFGQITNLNGQPLPNFVPDPSLEGGVDKMFLNQRFLSGQVGLRVDVPVDNSQARAQLRVEELSADRQRALITSLERQIEAQVVTAYRRLLADLARIHAAAEAVRLAEALVEGQQKRFKNGVAISFDVLRANDELARARIAYERAMTSGRISQARLELAQGTYLDDNHIQVK